MSNLKYIGKQLIPPVFIPGLRTLLSSKQNDIAFTGNFSSWDQAADQSQGYDQKLILEKVKNAMQRVKNGEAAFERDSVLFRKIEYSWQLLAGLFRVAAQNSNRLNVLDYGGSLGTTYVQNKHFLSSLQRLEWNIVEQPHFVECGKQLFEDNVLKFFYTIDEYLQRGNPDVIIFSSVLQYLRNPDEIIQRIIDSAIDHVIVDKTLVTSDAGDRIMIQQVPEYIYKTSYPVRLFNYEKLLSRFSPAFNLIAAFDCYGGYKPSIDRLKAGYKGFLLQRIKK